MKEAPFRGFFFAWKMAEMAGRNCEVVSSELSGLSWRIEVYYRSCFDHADY